MGQATEKLDYTFLSFAEKNPGIPLHAFILGQQLPQSRIPGIQYHLVKPSPDYSHPLREVYFRRHELIDQLEVEHALVVDCFDVLCLQPLPALESLVGDFAIAACTEHAGSRYILGQGYTSNFLNGGVIFWNLPRSRSLRHEIALRGRMKFRTVADDQWVINEVVQTKYFDQLRILPCQFNFRPHYNRKQKGWPTVSHLDGVVIYHNATCMEAVKRLSLLQPRAKLPDLVPDPAPLTPFQQFWRRLRTRLGSHMAE